MPFLVPALVSGVSDVLVLVLQSHRRETLVLLGEYAVENSTAPTDYLDFGIDLEYDDESSASLASLRVHRVRYLSVLAALRLLLLLFPLPYHSYTGTAIRFPLCYHLFYGFTLTAVLLHMLALSMIDPDSLAALTTWFNSGSTQDLLNRSGWWILFLSIVSVAAHIVMLIHVRSTAPSPSYFAFPNKKKKLVYYYNQCVAANQQQQQQHQQQHLGDPLAQSPPPPQSSINFHHSTTTATTTTTTDMPTSPIQKLSSQYDEFLTEMQTQISTLKKDWTHKLDDFTQRHLSQTVGMGIHMNSLNNLSSAANGNGNANGNHFNNNNNTPNNSTRRQQQLHHNNPLLPLTPFRVLLQLFAYQDVIDSGKLDAVFDMDHGQSVTFFVPQLLSFLLHGAYYESDPTKLEAWILDKCQHHAHFAHRCFWFLRAWSLEEQQPPQQIQQTNTSTTTTSMASSSQSQPQQQGLRIRSSSEEQPFSLSRISMTSTTMNIKGETTLQQQLPQHSSRHSRSNSLTSLTGGNIMPGSSSHTKLLPEERAVVEDLMLRVVQRGETAARILQYGRPSNNNYNEGGGPESYSNITNSPPNDMKKKKRRGKRDKVEATTKLVAQRATRTGSTTTTTATTSLEGIPSGLFWDQDEEEGNYQDQHKNNQAMYPYSTSTTLVPELVMTPEMEASLPVDLNTGFPSHRHLEALTVTHRYGFLPLATAKKERQILSKATTFSNTDSFQATPRFLDALLAIADGLFLVPREQRRKELQRQLQTLEVELLPANEIYVPISNVYHRVWRIVFDESIALNTKERVPCIILLEVVDYENDNHRDKVNTDTLDDEDNNDARTAFVESWDSRRTKEKRPLELPKLGMPRSAKKKKKKGGALSNSTASAPSSESTPTPGSALPFSLPYYTMMGGMTEMEIVNQWRYAKRDPHRGESILDKMTSSLPLDMTRMKEKIHQLRGNRRAIFHDFLSLSSPEDQFKESGKDRGSDSNTDQTDPSASRDQDSEIAAFLCNDPFENTKIVPKAEGKKNSDETVRDLSPDRHPPDASMGQWTSPTSGARPTLSLADDLDPEFNNQRDSSSFTDRGRLSRQNSNDLVSTAYGSTYEGRGQSSGAGGRPPLSHSRTNSSTGNPAMDGSSNAMAKKSSAKRPPHQPHQVVFRENWQAKEERLRKKSAFGSHPGWRVLPILVKANDDLRQEQLASQLIQRMAFILARERIPVWLCPYEIIAITDRGGIMEAIVDTISLDSLKRNDPNFVDLNTFFHSFFGDNVEELADAKANFVESLAAYSIVTFLLQIKDRHNGNILLDNRGHLIHIDFGFFFLSSPGKNTGFESAPFKLTRDFVEVLGGPDSHAFRTFRELCVRSFLVLRRHCMEIILLVEMLKSGNEDLACFRGRPDDAIKGLRERFRLDLSDRACKEYVHSLIDESLENWRTNWYDRYQRYCVGVL